MEIQGYAGLDNLWLVFMVFYGNLTSFDMDHDPVDNLSVKYTLRLSSHSKDASLTKVWVEPLAPGNYIWVNFFTTDSVGTASSLSVTVSVIYK